MLIRDARPDDAEALSALSAELGYPVPAAVMRERISQLSAEHAVLSPTMATSSDGSTLAWSSICSPAPGLKSEDSSSHPTHVVRASAASFSNAPSSGHEIKA